MESSAADGSSSSKRHKSSRKSRSYSRVDMSHTIRRTRKLSIPCRLRMKRSEGKSPDSEWDSSHINAGVATPACMTLHRYMKVPRGESFSSISSSFLYSQPCTHRSRAAPTGRPDSKRMAVGRLEQDTGHCSETVPPLFGYLRPLLTPSASSGRPGTPRRTWRRSTTDRPARSSYREAPGCRTAARACPCRRRYRGRT